jgi:glycerol-1-phosphate dehydrogenase [NAD(P)+]
MSSSINQPNEIHRIDLPRIVLVGRNVLENLGGICKELNFKRALIVTGRTTFTIAGKLAQEIMADSGVFSSNIFAENAQLETIGRVMEEINSVKADVVVGVGGGRNIDVAKVSAARTSKDFISIPTIASHDGIASSLASVKGMGRPYTVRAVSPIAVIMDSEIIGKSPYKFTAAGCGDVISKITEVEDWKLAHQEKSEYYGAYAGSLALMSSQVVMENAENIALKTDEGTRTVLEALISCGVSMSIAGSSRPCSGSAHLFNHALDIIAAKPALHGEQCGVGAIMMARLHGMDWEYVRLSLQTIGAPVNAKQMGITREEIIEALTQAQSIRPERYTILSKIELDAAKSEAIAEECLVI